MHEGEWVGLGLGALVTLGEPKDERELRLTHFTNGASSFLVAQGRIPLGQPHFALSADQHNPVNLNREEAEAGGGSRGGVRETLEC